MPDPIEPPPIIRIDDITPLPLGGGVPPPVPPTNQSTFAGLIGA